ncbi:PTS sugar transporter subunit IIB [Lacticaseibacillus paracasei]|uniref:PTS sugar transporter subunit IIB n=1 Tax=Lacticaseibacillus paracasei TaxID=1597 RepID=UPI0005828F33|nr:PTS sugar transporter subunit IIB [Lacticaseibacillus paracasei]CAD7482659.1 conserved hypothetical protein [Lacticaseibacillus paracasei]
MKALNIISVCGSGTVTSSMIAGKVKDLLEDNGYTAKTIEANPGEVDSLIDSGSYDLIVHTSPLIRKYDIPTIDAVGFLTGLGEDEFVEQLLATVKQITS